MKYLINNVKTRLSRYNADVSIYLPLKTCLQSFVCLHNRLIASLQYCISVLRRYIPSNIDLFAHSHTHLNRHVSKHPGRIFSDTDYRRRTRRSRSCPRSQEGRHPFSCFRTRPYARLSCARVQIEAQSGWRDRFEKCTQSRALGIFRSHLCRV